MKQYREIGQSDLVRKPRSDDGKRRRIPEELQKFIEGLALQKPPRSIASIHRQVVAVATQREWTAPSYHCVYDVVQNLNPALTTLAHHSSKVYQEKDVGKWRDSLKPSINCF